MRNNIPLELRALPQWVVSNKNKIPYTPRTGTPASVTDPATWGTYEEAIQSRFEYVGFVLTTWDDYTIIDLDNKPDKPATPEEWARHEKILNAFDSYTERSASGTGYHIIVRGKVAAGVHRDNTEIYSSGRYMICTGNVVRNSPITNHQPLLDIIYAEMAPTRSVDLVDVEGTQTDLEVINTAMRAFNADKFSSLCNGDMTGYPSQSEADLALLSIIAFYTRDNEQVRRIFRMTELGKRPKAVKNDTYLDYALGKIRAKQPAPLDFSQLIANATKVAAPIPEETPEPDAPIQRSRITPPDLSLPPGLVGELAAFFFATAIRPVKEVAIAAAIAITSGVCGRSYNISGSGLNQYLILLAKTGAGKEGALTGIERLIAAVRPQLPMIDQFLGPAAFASGQALVKVLNERPCFVSVLGEFGLTLQQLSDHRANSAQVMLRKVLLDLFSKSGWNQVLRSSVYSDTEKNTKIIQAPAVTILGESTPETFFDGLDSSHVAEGLIPRFSIIEYSGDRPPRNRNSNIAPDPGMAQRFMDLVTISLTTTNNNTCAPVQMDDPSLLLLDDFDTLADRTMNRSKLDTEVQCWNRSHLKALKLAALLAVGVNPHQPIITADLATWAIDFVKRDVELIVSRFKVGDVGQGDSKQYNDLKKAIEAYYDRKLKMVHDDRLLWADKIIPYRAIQRRTASVASFRHDKMGSTHGIKRTIQTFIDNGMLVEVSRQDLIKKYGFSGIAYAIGTAWR